MAVRIFEEEKGAKDVYVRLEYDDGDLDLVVVDANGEREQAILTISNEGLRLWSLYGDYGLETDSSGYITVQK